MLYRVAGILGLAVVLLPAAGELHILCRHGEASVFGNGNALSRCRPTVEGVAGEGRHCLNVNRSIIGIDERLGAICFRVTIGKRRGSGGNIAGIGIGNLEFRLLPHGVEGIDLAGKADVVCDVACAEIKISNIVITRGLAPTDNSVAGLGEASAIGQGHTVVDLDAGHVVNRAGTTVGIIVNGGNIQGRIIREDGLDTNDVTAVFRHGAHGSGVHSKGRAQSQFSAVRKFPTHQSLAIGGIGNCGGCDRRSAIGIARAGKGHIIAVAIRIEDGEGVGADHLPGGLDMDMLYKTPSCILYSLINVVIRNTGAHDISFLGSVRFHNIPAGKRGNILAVFHPYRGSSIHGLVEVQPERRALSGR